jgi:hypothetical protein
MTKKIKEKTWAKTTGDLAKILQKFCSLQINKISLKELKNNLFEVTLNNDTTLQDLVILKTGGISPGKCNIKYNIIKLK